MLGYEYLKNICKLQRIEHDCGNQERERLIRTLTSDGEFGFYSIGKMCLGRQERMGQQSILGYHGVALVRNSREFILEYL